MTILHLVDTLGIGGAERMVAHLAKGFAQRGHRVAVACLYEGGPLAEPLEQAGIPVHVLSKPKGLHLPTLWKLARIVRGSGAEAVHTHNPQVHHYGVAAAKLGGAGVVVNTLHGANNLDGCGGAALLLYGAAGLGTGAIVAVSKASERFFEEVPYLPKGKLTVVYNGIPVEAFTKVGPPPGGGLTFGMVGRLVPIKDHGTALEAFAEAVQRRPDVRLAIAGDGPAGESLREQAVRLGVESRVRLHGAVSDIPSFLAGIDIYVMSSLSEGMPMSLLEAMAAARPVVATAVGGIPEIVESSGCGWLCPSGDARQLARAMLEAAGSAERAAKGASGRAWVLRHCTLETMVDRYERIFENLISGRRAAG